MKNDNSKKKKKLKKKLKTIPQRMRGREVPNFLGFYFFVF